MLCKGDNVQNGQSKKNCGTTEYTGVTVKVLGINLLYSAFGVFGGSSKVSHLLAYK